jgi:4-hydroxybenzoate polyprenyltransferase
MTDPTKLGKTLAQLARPQNALYPALLASASAFLTKSSWAVVAACFFLFICLYAVAATYNNIHDVKTDRLNLRKDNPLVFTPVSVKTLQIFMGLNSLIALCIGLTLRSPYSLGIVAVYVVLLAAYSHPKLKLQARGWLSPVVLSICYGGLPLLLGLIQNVPVHNQWLWQLPLLQALLTFPITLVKDYKDIVGDTVTGKRTPVVRHGERVVQTTAIAASMLSATYFVYLARLWPLNLSIIIILAGLYITSVAWLHFKLGQLPIALRQAYTLLLLAMPMVIVWKFAAIFC